MWFIVFVKCVLIVVFIFMVFVISNGWFFFILLLCLINICRIELDIVVLICFLLVGFVFCFIWIVDLIEVFLIKILWCCLFKLKNKIWFLLILGLLILFKWIINVFFCLIWIFNVFFWWILLKNVGVFNKVIFLKVLYFWWYFKNICGYIK